MHGGLEPIPTDPSTPAPPPNSSVNTKGSWPVWMTWDPRTGTRWPMMTVLPSQHTCSLLGKGDPQILEAHKAAAARCRAHGHSAECSHKVQ